MKSGIHPAYNFVVFSDASSGKRILTRSTIKSEKTTTWEDGKTYPLVNVDISMYSHPFFTGQQKLLDAAGRVEKFERRYTAVGGKTVERKPQKQKAIAKVPPKPKGKFLSSAPTARDSKSAKDAKNAKKPTDAKKAK